MPTYESSNRGVIKSLNQDKHGYNKLFAMFRKNDNDKTLFGKASRVSIGLKNDNSLNDALLNLPSGEYNKVAAADLSSIFMPFQSESGVNKTMPGFHTTIGTTPLPSAITDFHRLLPFKYNKADADYYEDRYVVTSGDTLTGLLSSEEYIGAFDRLRDNSNVRGIGLRLPIMGVGWGYTTEGYPWPSGGPPSGVSDPSGIYFKGGHLYGRDVDPSDYIAAPIDLRYDSSRNVWTSSENGFYAIITNSRRIPPQVTGAASGIQYAWVEADVNSSGALVAKPGGRVGTFTRNPAYEINNTYVANNTKIWLSPKTNKDFYNFSFNIPPGAGKYKVLTIIDDGLDAGSAPFVVTWDYPRFTA